MLQDGLPYADIINNLGDDAENITATNLSRWKDSGYQDWLLEQSFLTRTRIALETAADLSDGLDVTRVTHATLQLATLQIFEALRDLQPGSLDEKLGGDSAAFARLLNALSRASKETMELQSYRATRDSLKQAFAGTDLPSIFGAVQKQDDTDSQSSDDETAPGREEA